MQSDASSWTETNAFVTGHLTTTILINLKQSGQLIKLLDAPEHFNFTAAEILLQYKARTQSGSTRICKTSQSLILVELEHKQSPSSVET